MDNQNRSGFATSSQMSRIAASLKSGKPSQGFFGYIEEIIAERLMGRVASVNVKTRPMKWGNLMEIVLFNLLGMDYEMAHKKTIKHHKYSKIWSGTPDLIAAKKIGEIKCFEPKAFSLLSHCLLKKDVDLFKEKFPKEYWQCVSNAILCKVQRAEIIAYMPYRSELIKIIDLITSTDFLVDNGLEPNDYYFMTTADIETMAYLPDDSPMSNINSFEFEVPMEDQIFLTKRIIEAEKLVKEGLAA